MDLLNYKNKVCVVTGGASGVGSALVDRLVDLGAIVYVLDIYEVPRANYFIKTDLSDKTQIDIALSKLPEKIDKFFSNAALPGIIYQDQRYSVIDVFTVNYVAAKYLIEKISERMDEGGAIAVTSSITGEYWKDKMDLLTDLYESGDTFEKAVQWAKDNGHKEEVFAGDKKPQNLYVFTKESLQYLVSRKSHELMLKGIRINATAPGAIDSAMTPDFGRLIEETEQFEYAEEYAYAAVSPSVRRSSTGEEQADCLIFLNSDLARVCVGSTLNTDLGFQAGVYGGICTKGGYLIEK